MTAVRFRESAGYGARLYAYLLGVTLLGGAGLGLGVALAWPEAGALLGDGGVDTTDVAASLVLSVLGLTVLSVGYLGAGYKLIADAVDAGAPSSREAVAATTAEAGESAPSGRMDSAGSSDGDGRSRESAAADRSPEVGPQQAPGVDPAADAGTPDANDPAGASVDSRTEEGAEEPSVTADRDEYGSRQTEGPPEPSPGEIAFGSSAEDAAEPTDDGDAADEPEESLDEPVDDGGSLRPAGRNAPSDPLADPTDEE